MADRELTIKQQMFYADYLLHGDATRAYRAAYDCSKMKDETVSRNGHELVKHPLIAAKLEQHRKKQEAKLEFGVMQVMQELIDIATADPGELIQYRTGACRHCWGVNNQYQYVDDAEFAGVVIEVLNFNQGKSPKTPSRDMPVELGGYGYDARVAPNDDCKNCWGVGLSYVWIADTRTLTGKARKLYAGVKQTPNGVQVLMRNQDAALQSLGKALGMFIERVQIGGEGGGPVLGMQLPTDPQEASKIYQAMVKSHK